MASSTRRALRGGPRAAPEPAPPPKWLKRKGTDFESLKQKNIQYLLEAQEGKKGQTARRQIAPSYVATLNSSDPDARSSDGLSKQEIADKLELCVEAYWETYDEAMDKFRTQNVEAPAPAPAAVAPEPEDLEALKYADLTNLVTAREARKWAATQKKKYEKDTTSPGMRELLRDQAADPSQWAIVAQHQAPAPKYADETVSKSLTKGRLDADTWAKWMEGLTVGPWREEFESPQKDAPFSLLHTFPTLSGTDAAEASIFRGKLVTRLGRPAEPRDVVEALVDEVDKLEVYWVDGEMVPDGLTVTVDDLRHRLEVLEAPDLSEAQMHSEPRPISAARRKELECNTMFFACGLKCELWSRDLALALGDDGIADYAKKWADLKQDHHGNIGRIVDVRAAVAARIRNNRRGLLFTEGNRSVIRHHTLPMRTARNRVHRTAVTSSHCMTWGY